MARPTKLNDKVIDKICDSLRQGNYIDTACACAGIDDSTYFEWMKRAENGEEIYQEFAESVKKAQSDAEEMLLATIRQASITSWQAGAWILERTRNIKYGQRQAVAVDATVHQDYSSAELFAKAEELLAALKGIKSKPDVSV